MAEFARRKINFTAVKVNESCNAMIKVMQNSYASVGGAQMILNDLAHACSTKSAAEVTKDFIKESSYILRAAIGGPVAGGAKGKGGASVAKKAKAGPALWDTKQFAVSQILSQTTYYNVTAVDGGRVTVQDQHGNLMHVSRDIVEKMASGTHFVKEVPMNMTGLAELLE